jgi:DNA repair exonuclease SbcCD ATPase subunit
MKITSLKVQNVGMVEDADIKVDKPLLLFFGEPRQGKTTLLNALRWGLGGEFPDDIIRHGQPDAAIQIGLDCGSIKRTFYRGEDGVTRARAIQMVVSGETVKRPSERIRDLLNPFLLNQDYFKEMNGPQRARYLVELFGVDVKARDIEIQKLEKVAQDLRATVKAYGTIGATPVQPAQIEAAKAAVERAKQDHEASKLDARKQLDAVEQAERQRQEGLRRQIQELDDEYRAEVAKVERENVAIVSHNAEVDRRVARKASLTAQMNEVRLRISNLEAELEKLTTENYELAVGELKVPQKMPVEPKAARFEFVNRLQNQPAEYKAARDSLLMTLATTANVAALEAVVQQEIQQDARYQQYLKELDKVKEREVYARTLKATEEALGTERAAKIATLKELSGQTGIQGLEFTEDGSFRYCDTAADMLSTSQSMELSSLLRARYPEGLGIELIDRAESLGKSIYGFIERAKQSEITILATIVGEKPAVTPEDVGVWMVENGKLK